MTRKEVSRDHAGQNGGIPAPGGWGTFGSLRNEMNRLFDRFSGFSGARPHALVEDVRSPMDLFESAGWPFGRMESAFGQTDLSETDESYELEVDLPGLKREDVSVDYANGMLTLSAERTDEREDKRRGYYLSERSYGAFRRSFRVPDNVEADRIEARFADGVLTVRLPKSADAQASSRRIAVSGG